jgi:hypothetical protein
MHHRLPTLLILIAGSFAVIITALPSLPAAAEEKPTGDLAALQGKWRTWLAADDYLVFEVSGKSFTMVRHTDGKQTDPWTGTIILDETRSEKRGRRSTR